MARISVLALLIVGTLGFVGSVGYVVSGLMSDPSRLIVIPVLFMAVAWAKVAVCGWRKFRDGRPDETSQGTRLASR